jgi:hypothetical protein
VQPAVPGVEVADHPDGAGVGRPDAEGGPGHPVDGRLVGAQLLPQPLVAALAQQVLVELADGRPEPVWVVDGEGARGVADLQPVGRRRGGAVQGSLEQPGVMHLVQLDSLGLLVPPDQRHHPGGVGTEDTDDHPAVLGVGSQQTVWLVVLPADQPLDLILLHGFAPSRRRMPPSGIWSHGGRCLASYITS